MPCYPLKISPCTPPSPKATGPTKSAHKAQSSQATSPYSTAQVWDIMGLKWAFPNSFNTIGNMSGMYTIRTDPSILPIQHIQCKVPIEYWEQIENMLDDMVAKGVITPVSQPTEWVSLLTYPYMPDGSPHICLNPKDLNKAIVWDHYKAPTLDEISHCLTGATCFGKFNVKDGFWSIHLDWKSSYLTTFNMHHGRYHFLHMPFGLKMSQDIFQIWMDQATDHLPSITAVHDDICVFGYTPKEHDWHLMHLMETTMEHSITFNSAKCQIRQPQIAFYGTVFTAQGMWLDPTKIQALQDLPTPNSQAELQSFIGLIKYLQPFIPSLSAKSMFLCGQLAQWDWNTSMDAAFQHLKAWICQTLLNATLAYYDQSKSVVVQMDTSGYRLGTALKQSGYPIAFASKKHTDVETCYANIDKECLSVCFSLQKFHTYIYGRHGTVENDHKVLEMMQQKPIHVAPPWLQWMPLCIQKYD